MHTRGGVVAQACVRRRACVAAAEACLRRRDGPAFVRRRWITLRSSGRRGHGLSMLEPRLLVQLEDVRYRLELHTHGPMLGLLDGTLSGGA